MLGLSTCFTRWMRSGRSEMSLLPVYEAEAATMSRGSLDRPAHGSVGFAQSEDGARFADVVVIGAGQAGLSAGYHLARLGFSSALATSPTPPTFVMLDANPVPGGAWQHRWESLRMATVNGIFDLPGLPQPDVDPREPSRTAVPRYFADFEARMDLPILRPVTVLSVSPVEDSPTGDLIVTTSDGVWRTRAVINASGTWDNPVIPSYPGQETFLGRQIHTRDYVSLDEFAGQRVAVVGGGISALQQLEEISRVAKTFWYTRREPVFREGFTAEVEGRETIAQVTAAVEAGEPSRSIVGYTGLPWSSYAREAKARRALERRPMFTAIEPHGVREADGSLTTVDAILWATGFRPALDHLAPLRLHNERGGVEMRGTQVANEPRVHLIGFGPSQSTVGANRAGRAAARTLARRFVQDGSKAD